MTFLGSGVRPGYHETCHHPDPLVSSELWQFLSFLPLLLPLSLHILLVVLFLCRTLANTLSFMERQRESDTGYPTFPYPKGHQLPKYTTSLASSVPPHGVCTDYHSGERRCLWVTLTQKPKILFSISFLYYVSQVGLEPASQLSMFYIYCVVPRKQAVRRGRLRSFPGRPTSSAQVWC